MNTSPSFPQIPLRRRRTYTKEFKDECIRACMHPGVSIARVALGYGLNANLLRRWISEAEQAQGAVDTQSDPEKLQAPPAPSVQEAASFVPLRIEAPPNAASADINIQINRMGTVVTVTWPASAASACALWLREVLR